MGADKDKDGVKAAAKLRRQAEERLNANCPESGIPQPDAETERLIHELQVHQIELELQNSELQLARDELEMALDKYTDLYDFAPTGYFTLNCKGIISAVNLTGASMLNIERRRLPGLRFQLLVTNEYRTAFADFLAKVFLSTAKESCEMMLLKEGSPALFVQIEGLTFESRQECRIALIDITERKQAEEKRLSLEKQLFHAHKLESLGVLAGGIAHDFNNIITAIMGNISYTKMILDEPQQASESLARAEKALKRAAVLAKQLLVFAKGGDPVKKSISVLQAVNDAVSLALSGSNVGPVIDLPIDLHAINADEGQISQVFENITINAVQAMPDGGILTVSAENVTITENSNLDLAGGDYVKICFTDEGCGIAAEDLERIFDPYFTTKVSGSGLGLALTYAIIKKHSGHISVSSSLGKGASFTILFPGCGEPVNEEMEKIYVPANAQGVISILVMDDDEMVRELADITMKHLGYAVVCCSNGTEAVSLYQSAREERMPFSLVFMDLTIPGGMGGVEAARQILAYDPKAQLIVSSGYSDDPVMANFADFGFCDALEKPYNITEIARIISKN